MKVDVCVSMPVTFTLDIEVIDREYEEYKILDARMSNLGFSVGEVEEHLDEYALEDIHNALFGGEGEENGQ